jgi:hypothetical protein
LKTTITLNAQLKYDKLYRKIARDRWAATKYTSESGENAANKRWEED